MPEQKADVGKPQQPVKPMEDDDEFEEFDVEGTNHSCAALRCKTVVKAYPNQMCCFTGWKEEDEDPAKAELWEADWDDTSVSDNFAQQLRTELQSHAKK